MKMEVLVVAGLDVGAKLAIEREKLPAPGAQIELPVLGVVQVASVNESYSPPIVLLDRYIDANTLKRLEVDEQWQTEMI